MKANGFRASMASLRKKANRPAVQGVGAGLGDDVDGSAAGPTQLSGIVAAVDLELLHRVLADIQTHTTGLVVRLATVYGHAIAAPVAAIKGQATLWSLLHAVVGVTGDDVGVAHARHQQGEGEIVAAIDGQIGNLPFANAIRLAAPGSLNHRRRFVHDHLRSHGGYAQVEVSEDGLAEGDNHAFADLGREPVRPHGHTVGGRRQGGKLVLTAGIGHCRTLQAGLRVCHGYVCVGNDPAGGIRDCAAKYAGGTYPLRVGERYPQQRDRQQKASLGSESGDEPANWC